REQLAAEKEKRREIESKARILMSRIDKETKKVQALGNELAKEKAENSKFKKDYKKYTSKTTIETGKNNKPKARSKAGSFAGAIGTAGHRIIAAQILTLPCKTTKCLDQTFELLAKAGINTLIFRVFNNKGDRYFRFLPPQAAQGVYFKTDRAPVVSDALSIVVSSARRHGLAVWAWMTTRYATYGLNMGKDWQAGEYDFASGTIIPAKGLNLFNPMVQEHLAGLFRDLAAYDLDGILLQDDLVLRHNEGWSPFAREAFKKEMGLELDPRDLYHGVFLSENGKYYVSRYSEKFWDWSAWKNRKLLELAKKLMLAAKGRRPGLKFGINLMYEAVTSPRNALAWLSQSLPEAKKDGFDLFSVMAYHRQIKRELNLKGKELDHFMAKLVKNAVKTFREPSRVMIKLQVRDWRNGTRIPVSELDEMLSQVLKTSGISIGFVPVSGPEDLKALKKAANRLAGM
ncbi:MAG: family 10 glycosylhydrolase, partial [Deltaproteobacteria bacterium]|nr:family 10 glycosylhydrolase [Deltaproteobacteria bacterium]